MSVDTEIEGQPGSIETAASWLRDQLAVKVGEAADAMNDARRDTQGSWREAAGDELEGLLDHARGQADDLEQATITMADDLDTFAEKLRRCKSDMADVRQTAREADLTVTGFIVEDPGAGPARPPDEFEGTEEEVAAHDDRVEAYNEHQDLITAYNAAVTEADRVDRAYATACQELQNEYTPGQHASWIVTVTDILGDSAAGFIGAQLVSRQSPLLTRAQDLLDEAAAAITDLQANPDRYIRRRWFFFETLDQARLDADRLAIEGRLDEAEDLIRQSDDLRLQSQASGPSRVLRVAGRVLGPLGLGLGVYNDYQEGETTEQIIVSQGASTALGVAAGAGATIGTAALTGAALGSVVPGIGTAAGAIVGTVVGAGVAIFADGAIDSLFENGPDVGAAWDSGVDALADTGEAIADGVGGAIDTVGGWFS